METIVPKTSRFEKNRRLLSASVEALEPIAALHPQGLVVMKFIHAPAPYEKGDIAGLPLDTAAKYFRYRVAVPCTADGEELSISLRSDPVPQRPVSSTTEIPDDWENRHFLQQIRLAKEIQGSEQSPKLEEAKEVIRAEIQRRMEK
jgi:hypothetical protein